ncbi:MAG: phosphatase PAP2 family protein [Reyranella sp.]|nr:MAG: phosphatase PAP2 family protein [Reyranella sp.]
MKLVTPFIAVLLASASVPALATDKTAGPAPRAQGWLVKSYGEVEMPAAAATAQQAAELKKIAVTRSADDMAKLQWWSVGGPAYRWNEILLDQMQEAFVTLPMSARHLALFQAALDDATAVARAQRKGTTGPSEYAAAAAAAAEVMSYFFPAKAAEFAAKADEAIRVRLAAGADQAQDAATGRAIGQRVGTLAVAYGKADGSDAKWTGSVPEGADKWKGTNPIAPMAGTWKAWVLSANNEFRPAPPPAVESEKLKKDLAELKEFKRSPKSNHRATFWEVNGGARAHTMWNDIAREKLLEYGYSPAVASRVLTAVNVALLDAGIACWDAKFTFWYPRPTMVDAELKSVFPPPNHPSYPAAHGCFSTAAAVVLAGVFPQDKARLLAIGKEAAEARVWAGIHYRFDIDAGQEIGRKVAEKTLERSFGAKGL